MNKNLNNKVLDDLNLNILKELCENARVSNTEIGRRVGLSSPAVAERIQKLEEQGIITGSTITLDFDSIGLVIQAFITFKAETIKHEAMVQLFNSMPEIIEWYSITGNASMLLKVVVSSSKELEAIVEKLFVYGETSTSLILSCNRKKQIFRI